MKSKDQIVLEYLSDKMEAPAEMIGEHMYGTHVTYATRSAVWEDQKS